MCMGFAWVEERLNSLLSSLESDLSAGGVQRIFTSTPPQPLSQLAHHLNPSLPLPAPVFSISVNQLKIPLTVFAP